ncbi:OLC1v1010644C1 [Oldenlandia corymbosa var. corymbosa]|uniref:OLC1v1010644C1 n=1 Tax=Oldenlandia corymbosa var. corymbosa TaxID=529605 RepID=A0AAV1DUI8_OLDCO|nr:OLC1v1010644C1 [Oldenlandia corymbosa var. corymbosa]
MEMDSPTHHHFGVAAAAAPPPTSTTTAAASLVEEATAAGDSPDYNTTPRGLSSAKVSETLRLVQSHVLEIRVEAAKEIRRLTKTSQRYRRYFSGAVRPLVQMLSYESVEANESALLALLNLAVKDETNKISIIDAGALDPIIGFLQSDNPTLQEHATASLLTLSASSVNKPIISDAGIIPLLVEILRDGCMQAKVDAVMALYNLSTHPGNLSLILHAEPIPYMVDLLKFCKKSSKTAEKCTALIESLVTFEECRIALTSEEGGVLAVVEVLESGSPQSREHALGALLTMCQSDRCKYREPILKEGAIPGLLELTVQGSPKSQSKAQTLLRLLRDSPYPRSELQPDTLENIVSTLISQIDGEDQCGKAKQMLSEMVQVSMEQSLRHLQQRALVYTPTDLPVNKCASEVSSK